MQLGILIFLCSHILLLITTNYSLTGYWTDVFIPILLIFALVAKHLQIKLNNSKQVKYARPILVIISLIYLMIGIHQTRKTGSHNLPSSIKLTSFNWIKIDNSFFNAYFIKVGSYSGGEGNIWITESPTFFPIIEQPIYYKHAILWDFGADEWDGQKIDQSALIRELIKDEIINKQQRILKG